MDTRRAAALAVGAALCLMAVAGPADATATQGSSGWTQLRGDPAHTGAVAQAAAPPYQQAWALPVAPGGPNQQFGLSAPVIDPVTDTAVSVGPDQVLGVDLRNGSRTFSVNRVFGPSVPAAIAQVSGKTAIVYTQGWGDTTPSASPSATASASPSPSASAGPSASASASQHVSQLVAIDLATHRRLWAPVALAAHAGIRPSRSGVTVSDGTAYVGDTGGSVYAVDLATGKLRWTEPAGAPIATPVAATSDIIVVATQGTRTTPAAVVGLKASDGSVVWRYDAEPVGALATGAIVSGSVAYAAFSDGNVVAIELSNGSLKWSARINAPALPSIGLAVSGGALYVSDIVGQLYRFDANDGSRVWDFALNGLSYNASPVVAGDRVLVATDAGQLAAFDVDSGHLVWESAPQGGLLRGLTPTDDLVVAVRGGDHAGLVAYQHDDAGALVDTVSPTVFNAGTNALSFAAAAIPLFALALILGRMLSRRMGPAFIYDDDDAAPYDPIEDGTDR